MRKRLRLATAPVSRTPATVGRRECPGICLVVGRCTGGALTGRELHDPFHHCCLKHGPSRRCLEQGRVAGERQEHVVKRRMANAQIIECDAVGLEALASGDEHRAGTLRGHAHAPLVGIDAGRAVASSAISAAARSRLRALETRTSSRSPPSRPLSSVAVPSRDDPAGVHHDDLMRKVLGLLHVLGRQQHGRAIGDEILDEAPHAVAGARIQTRGRLVQEQDPRTTDQAGPDVKAPAHPAGVGLDELSAASVSAKRSSTSWARRRRSALLS